MGKINVNKTEAARRQIDTAIRLLFDNEDPVAIHTLAMAGFRVLRDIADQKGNCNMSQGLKSCIRPGMERKFWGDLQSFSNFLKHADKDLDAISNQVDEEVNDITLLMASKYYHDLGYQYTPEMESLVAWFYCNHHEHIADLPPLFGPVITSRFHGFLSIHFHSLL